MKNLTNKQKKMLGRILCAGGLLLGLGFLPAPFWMLYLIPYLTVGWDVLYKALRNIKNGQVFDENFLMAIATIGAFFHR